MEDARNKLITDIIGLLKENAVTISREGRLLKVNDEEFEFPSVSETKTTTVTQFR